MDNNPSEEKNKDQSPKSTKTKPKAQTCNHVPIIIVLVLLLICTTAFAIVAYVTITQDKEPIAGRTMDDNWGRGVPIPESETSPDCSQSTEPEEEQNGRQPVTSIDITIHAKHVFRVLKEGTPDSYLDAAAYAAVILDDEFYVHDEKDIFFSRVNSTFSGISPTKNIKQEFSFDGEVTRAMVSPFGNGGNEAILLQFSDGTIGAIYLDYREMTFKAIKHLEGVSGITALYEGYEDNGAQVFAVDANGKAIGLYNKIWKY